METRMPLTLPRLAAFGLASSFVLASSAASAQSKQECIKASERGQQLRDEGKLAESRQQFLVCVQEACPRPVADACREDLGGVEKRLPSVVLGAKDASGTDLVDVQVQIDGALATQKLDGRAIPINPGPHKVRMEANGQVVEQQVVVIEGEKSRPVRLAFPGPGGTSATPTPAGPSSSTPAGGEQQASSSEGVPPATWIFGGLAVASVGAFAFFALKGTGEIHDLRDTCGRTQSCAQNDVDAAKSKLLIGDIFLGVGVVSAGIATYFALAPRSADHGAAHAKAKPIRIGLHGLGLGVSGQFE